MPPLASARMCMPVVDIWRMGMTVNIMFVTVEVGMLHLAPISIVLVAVMSINVTVTVIMQQDWMFMFVLMIFP